MQQDRLDEIMRGAIAAVPLFGGIKNLPLSFYFFASVLFSVLICRLCLALIGRVLTRSLRSLFALVILASILEMMALIGEAFWIETLKPASSFLPFTLLSAFLLIHADLAGTNRSFSSASVWGWVCFGAVLLLIGALRSPSSLLQTFSPAPFFILGAVLAVFSSLNSQRGSQWWK